MITLIIMIALSMALVIGTIIPVMNRSKATGSTAYQRGSTIGNEIQNVLK